MTKSLYTLKIFSNKKVIDQKASEINQIKIKDTTSQKAQLSKNVFTIEEAIDHIGFGWFQIKLLLLTGFAYVSS